MARVCELDGPWLGGYGRERVLLALVFVVSTLGAPDVEAGLRWDAPASCPDAARGGAWVDAYLGDGEHPEIAGAVTIVRDGDRWRATIDPVGAEPRILHADDCESVARAAALVIAVSLAPEAAPTIVEPDPEAEAEVEAVGSDDFEAKARESNPTVEAPASKNAAPARKPPRRRPIAIVHGLGLRAGPSFGPTPALAATIRAGYRIGAKWWRVEVDALYSTPRQLDYAGESIGGRFQALAGSVRGCGLPRAGIVAFPLCAGPEVGAMFGRGTGFDAARRRAGASVGIALNPGLEVQLRPWLALRIDGDLLFTLRRPAFSVGTRDELVRAARIGGRGGLGLEFMLP